ncbi:MAG: hypothetical protein JXR83_16865 [Deltaproteobacteria bacterium]|nr:hypothetical protein [Deltaproteobacteria bacterium]
MSRWMAIRALGLCALAGAASSPARGQQSAPASRPALDPRAGVPMLSVGAGYQALSWSYRMTSSAGNALLLGDLLQPAHGLTLGAGWWPWTWLGVDLRLDYGALDVLHSATVEPERVGVSLLGVEAALRACYRFEFGLGLGGHLGYRSFSALVARQTPVTAIPSVQAQLLSPGVDVDVIALAPWVTAHLALDLAPLGFYSESPDAPGNPELCTLWGWRFGGALRTTPIWGIFVELAAFYEMNVANYLGPGDRRTATGELVNSGRTANELSGLALSVGWSY